MMRECPYSTKTREVLYPCSTMTREVLGNPSPTPERFPETREISRGKSRGSREILRAEGMDFPIPPEFWWSTDILSSSIFLQGVDQKILPCGQGRIDSVKINPSLLMMRECSTHLHIVILLHYIGTHCCLVWLETNVRQGIFLASALCKLCAPCALCKPCALCRTMCTM